MKKLFIYAVLIGMCFAQGLYCKNAAVAMVGNKIILESDVRSKMSVSGDCEYVAGCRDREQVVVWARRKG